MSTSNIETSTTGTTQTHTTGRVKWFNNKAGYGFITATDGPTSGSDIFVHHSSVMVSSEQYRYLVQGEYVQFTPVTTDGGVHAVQAGSVSGINGGKLMCETRNEYKQMRQTKDGEESDAPELKRTESYTPRGPRENQSWSMSAGRGRGNGRGGGGMGRGGGKRVNVAESTGL